MSRRKRRKARTKEKMRGPYGIPEEQATARKKRREGRACLAVSIAIEILKEDLQTSMIQNGDRAWSHPRCHLQCCRSPFRYAFLGRVDLSLHTSWEHRHGWNVRTSLASSIMQCFAWKRAIDKEAIDRVSASISHQLRTYLHGSGSRRASQLTSLAHRPEIKPPQALSF